MLGHVIHEHLDPPSCRVGRRDCEQHLQPIIAQASASWGGGGVGMYLSKTETNAYGAVFEYS